MAKFIRLNEAEFYLNTSTSNIIVTACNYRKKNGAYPCWYKSGGKAGARKSYIDIDYIFGLRDKEIELYNLSCDLYYFITETMKIRQSHLAPILASKSEIYNKPLSWMSFMQVTLFCEPMIKFHERVTRLQEFHRIATELKEEYLCQNAT